MENTLKNKILNLYTNIYNQYFKNKNLKYSQIFQINDINNYITYRIILDPGFGITLVSDDGDIRIMDYLLGCEFYNYGVSFNYCYLGYIMLLGEKDYKLNVYDKPCDSFYEEPREVDLEILEQFLNILPNIIQNYHEDIFNSEDAKIIDLYINDNSIKKEEIWFEQIEHEGFFVTSYFDYQFNTSSDEYLVDLFNIEIPVYSEKRGKLINPFYLSVININTKDRKTFILDDDELNVYDSTIEILSNLEIGQNTYTTNPLLYEVLKENENDNIKFNYEPLDYSRYLEYFAQIESIYNNSNDNLDIEQLKEILSEVEECDKFLWKYFPDELDEALLEALNPHYFEIYSKYIKNINFDEESTFLDNLFSFQFFSTLKEKDYDRFAYDDYGITNLEGIDENDDLAYESEEIYYDEKKDNDENNFIN